MVKAVKTSRNGKSKGDISAESASGRGKVTSKTRRAEPANEGRRQAKDAKTMAKNSVSVEDKTRLEALDRALGQIDKMFGSGSVMKLDGELRAIPGISTGTISLDLALGGRGVPKGRIVEIYGPESSGKTTLALTTLAHCQASRWHSGLH